MKISKSIAFDGAWLRGLGVAAVSAVLALAVFNTASVHAATVSWDNGGADNKFSTAANWSTDTVPTAGDVLRFDTVPVPVSGEYSQVLDNDLGIEFAGLETVLASNPDSYSYKLANPLQLADGATWSTDGVNVSADVNAAGDVTFDGSATSGEINAVGNVTLTGGASIFALPVSATSLVIEKDSAIYCFQPGSDLSLQYPLVMSGGTGTEPALIALGACAGGGAGGAKDPVTLTVPNLTLNGDAQFNIPAHMTVDVQNLTDNGFAVTRTDSSQGTLKTPDGVIENQEKQTEYNGDQPTQSETVVLKETATLNGTRGNVYVSYGGTLKGEGTVQELTVAGVLSPGNSAGTITVVNSLDFGPDSTYVVELYGASSYDQLVVNSGAVNLQVNGTLDLRIEGAINQGDTFTIIDNQSTNPVNGEFVGLAEGDRLTIGDAVFSISYQGGDGNDVVLTALTTVAAPGTPNTGLLTTVNPVVVAVTGLVSAAAVAVVARHFV